MQKSLGLFLALATLSVAHAQSADPASQGSSPTPSTSQPAPIVQANPGAPDAGAYSGPPARSRQVFDAEPSPGVYVRSDVNHGVDTVTASSGVTELRVLQGRADITIHHPADHPQLLVDLPGGQVALLKDGLYTFNAGTNTVRVLRGEAEAYAGAKSSTKGTKVKETQQLALLSSGRLKAVEAYPFELTADLLPGAGLNHGDGVGYGGYGRYGEGFYGGYPYYAGGYGYPGYGFYPYGYGYPFGVGVGFGYYGGFRGGFRR